MKNVVPLAVVLACSLADVAQAADESKPNVLLIITDEHNFRTLGCYRELLPREQAEMWGPGVIVPTPHLDALAKQGVICTRAYATAPVCSPCRAAMITGRYPHVTGVPTNNLVLDRSIPTLADRLNDAGYRSSFIGKWHLGGVGKPEWAPQVDGGFQFKKYMFNRGHWKKFIIEDGAPAVGPRNNGQPNYNLDAADEKTFSTDWLTDRAIDFMIEPGAREQPFFTVISYPDPHGPNQVRPPYDHRFDDLRFQPPRTYQTGVPAPKWMASGGKHPVFRGPDMSRYFGMVQCIDDNIGKLIRRLKQTGQLENTLVMMTSDHGDLCYEHDRQNKGNPYEGSARVPMIVRFPGRIAANQVYTQPVGTVDVTPTVMGLLRLAQDPEDQGRDLSQTLADVSSQVVDASSPPTIFLRNSGTSARWVAAVDARYKLILSVSDDPWLFDNEQDPDELLNFYGRPGSDGVAERLAKELRDYGSRAKDPYFDHPAIAASLARALGEPIPEDQSRIYRSKWKGSRPAVEMRLPIGISAYFTELTYGGIGFAILEDRKFKTGPKSLPEDRRDDGVDADLLGSEQEEFLQRWSEDWSGQAMKCALSQTIFCRAATHTGQQLKRTHSYFDSGAWPKAARNRAVRCLGDCNAIAIHGDQHLGVLLRHGVDDFDDAGYALMVPGTANGFPRAWWPGVESGSPQQGQDYRGRYHDDAGHPIHVLAVGNPEPGSNKLPKTTDPMEIGYRKGSGYGMVEFDKVSHNVTATLYRLGDNEEVFAGFPVTVHVGGQPLR